MNNYNSKISILGVNPGHDASFCGVDSKGTTQWIFEEERFNRIKHSNFITFDSLKIQIKDKLLNPLDVDLIAYCFEIEPNLVESLYNRCHNNIHSEFGQNIVDDLNNQYLVENDAAFIIPLEELGQNQTSDKTSQKLHQLFPKAKIHGYNHHLSHAASTFFPSPFSESAVLIVDGAGLLETATIWHCSGDTTKEVFRIELPHSLGIFYEVVSHALCLEEGKVMGLSSFGNPRFVSNLRKNVIDVDEKMGFRYLAPIISFGDIETTEYACQELLRHIPIKRRSHSTDPISQEHADLAASAQQITEIILLSLVNRAKNLTGEKAICFAGGVMQNSVAMGKIFKSKIFKNYWVSPIPHDAGAAWGAALLGAKDKGISIQKEYKNVSFLGKSFSNKDISEACVLSKVKSKYCKNVANSVSSYLREGKVVAWATDENVEIGPRALGVRSYLADPSFAFNHYKLNKIKSREMWRPLGSVIRESDINNFVVDGCASPFMNLTFNTKLHVKDNSPAAVHIDNSIRLQTVSTNDLGGFHKILDCLASDENPGIMLNTSFNGAGEPLIQTPLEAIRQYIIGGSDILFLDHWEITSKPVLEDNLLASIKNNMFLEVYRRLKPEDGFIILSNPDFPKEYNKSISLGLSLEWMNIPVNYIHPENINKTLLNWEKVTICTFSPLADIKFLSNDLNILKSSCLWISNKNLFPSIIDLSIIKKRSQLSIDKLFSNIKHKKCFAWVKQDEQARISVELRGIIKDFVSNPLKNFNKLEDYLVISPYIFNKYKSDLNILQAGDDYTVWISDPLEIIKLKNIKML